MGSKSALELFIKQGMFFFCTIIYIEQFKIKIREVMMSKVCENIFTN